MSTEDKTITVTNNDIETEPGLGRPADMLALFRENNRLRKERNDWRMRAESAELTMERSSMPPTPKQKWAHRGKWGLLVSALLLLGQAAAKVWPEHADLIELATGWMH